ncbi:hypothetical protein N9491_02365 [Planktomarina temperata]|nr:hypothetical protein [Planktomarina temperata]
MSEQKQLVTELKKGWVYSTDPTVFFRGYDRFSEMLRNARDYDPSHVLNSYKKIIAGKIQEIDDMQNASLDEIHDNAKPSFASKIQINNNVLHYHLLRNARLKNYESETEEFYRFADELVKERCVVDIDNTSVAFLAYHGAISKTDDLYALLRKDTERPNQEERIKRKLLRAFDLLDQQNRAMFFKSLLGENDQETDCFKAVCSVHHQVVDNIDHWMDYDENPNWNSKNRSQFGDTLVFKISKLSFATHHKTSFANHDKSVREYINAATRLMERNEGKFWRLDYYDNGRGILKNLEAFGHFPVGNFNLLTAIKNKMSVRSQSLPSNIEKKYRKGEGFSTIIDEAQQNIGYVSITSGGQRVLSSPAYGLDLKHEQVKEFEFGTHLSIIFPG